MVMRLVQLEHPAKGRKVAVVEEPDLRVLSRGTTVYALAQTAIAAGGSLADGVADDRSRATLDYAALDAGQSPWRLLAPCEHPEEPARCLVTGTGLTHKASAENRQAMHEPAADAATAEPLTDSMKMYR